MLLTTKGLAMHEKEKLEKELGDLILKYSKSLDARQVAESVIGLMTTLITVKAFQKDETDLIYDDLCEIVRLNVQRTKIKLIHERINNG